MKVPGWGESTWDKVLSVVLVVAILGALGTLGYVIAAPRVGERFTEFYILGAEGKAADYPRELEPSDTAKAAPAVSVFGKGLFDVFLPEIGPQHRRKVEFAVSGLPEEEVAQANLTAGADD